MKLKKPSLKDLTQYVELAAAAFGLLAALLDLLSKVVNYGRGLRKHRVPLPQ